MLPNGSRPRSTDSIVQTADDDTIRVIVVAHKMFAESVTLRLVSEIDLEIVGCAYSAVTAAQEAIDAHARIAIIDYPLPDGDGLEVATDIGAADSETRVLILAERRDEQLVRPAVAAGCAGFLTKDADTDELVTAIHRVAAGESYVSSHLLPYLVPSMATNGRTLGTDLSPRESEVLDLLATGATTQQIASELFVSVTTVRNHIQRILVKLGAHSKLEAVVIAAREGIVAQPH